MRLNFAALAVGLALAGCDGDSALPVIELPAEHDSTVDLDPEMPDGSEPDAEVDAEVDSEPDAEAAVQPVFEMPAVEGIDTATDLDPNPDLVEVELVAGNAAIDLGELRVPVRVYDGRLPGPLIQAKVGDEIVVRFQNKMADPTTIHWHGLRISDQMDGNPRIQDPVPSNGTFEYRFVVPEAGSFWYHPHVRSHEQVEQGLYGPLVVHDPADPPVDVERFLVIDDILLDNAGQPPPFLASHPEVMHGRHGNVMLANGGMAPMDFETEQGRVERWRIVNTANARTFTLALSGAQFRVVGTDGGRINAPYAVETLRVAVGQRFDLEVRLDEPGEARIDAILPALNDAGEVVWGPEPMYRATVAETGVAPRAIDWPTVEAGPDRPTSQEAEMVFDGVQTPAGVRWRINGLDDPEEPIFVFDQGDAVRLRLVNRQAQEHPFHLHGQWFRIVEHPDGFPTVGLKDTVLVPGHGTVVIDAWFDNPGRWMAHCHILEHAELGMMAEIRVDAAP